MQRLTRWGSLMMADATPQTDAHERQVDKNKSALDKNRSCHSESNSVFFFYGFGMCAGAGQATRVFVCDTALQFRKPLIKNAFLAAENCLAVDKSGALRKMGWFANPIKILAFASPVVPPSCDTRRDTSATAHRQAPQVINMFSRDLSRAHPRDAGSLAVRVVRVACASVA